MAWLKINEIRDLIKSVEILIKVAGTLGLRLLLEEVAKEVFATKHFTKFNTNTKWILPLILDLSPTKP